VKDWKLIIAAAGLSLAIALPARAQVALDWIDPPPSGDAWTKRLETEAVRIAAQDAVDRGPLLSRHTVAFDYFYAAGLDQARLLGSHGVILVSVVTPDPKDFPIKRVVLRAGMKEVPLEPVAMRQSTVAADTTLAKTVGLYREDAFFLLPGDPPAKTANFWVILATPGRNFDGGRLTLTSRGDGTAHAPTTAEQLDPALLRKVLSQAYPDLIKP